MESTSYLPITILPTKTFQENEQTIFLSSSLMKYWGMKPFEPIHVCIGTRTLQANVEIKEVEKNNILFSEKLFASIPIPKMKYRFLSQYDKTKKRLYIGPIIALVTEVTELENGEPNFHSIHSFAEELHYTTSLAGGFFYVIQLKDFSMDGSKGWYFDGNDWKRSSIAPPNTFYNRIHSRKMEASPLFKKFKDDLSLIGIPIFNAHFLSKWEVHKILNEEVYLQPFLPDTTLFKKETLHFFLKKYDFVFIKPINGSQGRNIFRATLEGEKIIVRVSSPTEKKKEFPSIEVFLDWFQKYYTPSTYIIQQAIPFIRYENRQLDFRILCHRNHNELWRTSSIVSRVSAKEQFVSNLARGGEIFKPTKPLSILFDHQTVMAQIAFMKELSLEVACVISQSTLGLVGELGIDIGIDHDGRPWIIEVNSKPSKNAEEQKSNIRPSAKAIFEYATFLAFQQLRQL